MRRALGTSTARSSRAACRRSLGRCRARRLAARPRRRIRHVLDRLDAGRLPEGRCRRSLDRQRRPRVPRPVGVARRGNRRAVSLDRRRRRGRNAVGRQRQRRPGAEGREGRQAVDVLRCGRARGACARAGARTAACTSGTSPDGKIYQVAADGTSKTFFDPDDKYIWALAVDKSGNVFAATGDKGIIYKITPDGQGTPFYKTNAGNVVSLAFTKTGDLIAGTESPGRVFRIDSAGKAFVLLDSPFREIHAVRLADDGTIYAVAVNGTQGGESRATDPPTAPSRARAARAVGIDRDHSGDGRWTARSAGVIDAADAAPAAARRDGRDLSHPARWSVGRDVGFRRRRAVRSGDRAVGQPAGGHRAPKERSSASAAIRRAPRCSRAPTARQVTALLREPSGRIVGAASNPGKALRALPRAGATRHLRVRCARCRHRRQLGRDPLARIGDAPAR